VLLVDARHESIDAALTPEERAAALASVLRDAWLYWVLGRLGIMRLFGARLAAGSSPGATELPTSIRTLLIVQASSLHSIDAMLSESTDMTADDDRLRVARPVGALPLVVLTADSSIAQSADWGTAQETQRRLSNNSRLIVVPQSSHFVSFDQPQAVADAIQQVITAARTGQPLAR
jgi:pimeloyl-ACP methyl ester carboxylesterase